MRIHGDASHLRAALPDVQSATGVSLTALTKLVDLVLEAEEERDAAPTP
jgi:hypothetical protein